MADYKGNFKLLKSRPKLGLFDILVFIETTNPSMSYKEIIKRLIQFSTISSNCERVWRGENPEKFLEGAELKVLSVLALLMSEQEKMGDEI